MAVWDTAYVNNLPDSAFLLVEAGGKKDADGKTTPRSLRHFPVRDASGKVDAAHLRNALARIPQASTLTPAQRAQAMSKAKSMAKGTDVSGSKGDYSGSAGSGRSNNHLVIRSYALDDMTIRSDGDGRTVEAYAAIFNRAAEVRDLDGHYDEQLAPTSFDRTVAQNGRRFGVFYNHGRTIHGAPSGQLSVPIAVPAEAPRSDGNGLVTVSRYLDNPLADSILDGIKKRAIPGQSFSGRFIQSSPTGPPRRGYVPDADGRRTLVTRTEIAMREYGPTVFPVYEEAAILNVRSSWLQELAALDPEDMERFRALVGLDATPLGDSAPPNGTPGPGPAETPVAQQETADAARRTRAEILRRRINERR